MKQCRGFVPVRLTSIRSASNEGVVVFVGRRHVRTAPSGTQVLKNSAIVFGVLWSGTEVPSGSESARGRARWTEKDCWAAEQRRASDEGDSDGERQGATEKMRGMG